VLFPDPPHACPVGIIGGREKGGSGKWAYEQAHAVDECAIDAIK